MSKHSIVPQWCAILHFFHIWHKYSPKFSDRCLDDQNPFQTILYCNLFPLPKLIVVTSTSYLKVSAGMTIKIPKGTVVVVVRPRLSKF